MRAWGIGIDPGWSGMGEVRLPWEAQPIRDRTLFKPHGGGTLFRVPCQEKGVSDFCSSGCSVLAVSLIYMFHFRMTPFLVRDPLGVCCAAFQPEPGSFLESAGQGGRERRSSWWSWVLSHSSCSPAFDGGCQTVPLQSPGSPHQMESALPFTPGQHVFFFLLVMSPWATGLNFLGCWRIGMHLLDSVLCCKCIQNLASKVERVLE